MILCVATIYFFIYIDGTIDCSVGDVMAFFTSATCVPPIAFEKPLKAEFIMDDDILPTASTCDLILRIPTVHENSESFQDAFYLAVKGNDGFGKM